MLQFEMHGFMYGALMWLGNGDMVLRAPEKISATVRPEGLAPQPKNMGSLMAHAPSAQRVLGENRVRRVEGKMVPVVDFGAAAIDARYFKLVTQTHQGLEWRAINAWSPVFAVRKGAVMAIVMPILPPCAGNA